MPGQNLHMSTCPRSAVRIVPVQRSDRAGETPEQAVSHFGEKDADDHVEVAQSHSPLPVFDHQVKSGGGKANKTADPDEDVAIVSSLPAAVTG